jgi:hypothetical protein
MELCKERLGSDDQAGATKETLNWAGLREEFNCEGWRLEWTFL